MIELIKISAALLPVFIFLVILIFIDSYKLVKFRAVIVTILMGCCAAAVCSLLNGWVRTILNLEMNVFSRFAAPVIEELFKAFFIIYLIRSGKIGFMVDGAIYGFAIGAGFSLVENTYYLYFLENANIFVWIIRGFGTAIMHGGTTAIFAIFSKNLYERDPIEKFAKMLPGLALAIVIHGIYNQFFFGPVFNTVIFLTGLPILIMFVFDRSEVALREWLEMGFDSDAFLLNMIISGNISNTRLGRYLNSLKEKFPGEIVVDMLCLLRIHLELSIRVKGILLMREKGFDPPIDPDVKSKLLELKYLEKNIGKTGKLALAPIMHITSRDLWQIYLVKNK